MLTAVSEVHKLRVISLLSHPPLIEVTKKLTRCHDGRYHLTLLMLLWRNDSSSGISEFTCQLVYNRITFCQKGISLTISTRGSAWKHRRYQSCGRRCGWHLGSTVSVNEAAELQGASPERLSPLLPSLGPPSTAITHHSTCMNSSIIRPVVLFSINIQNTTKAPVIVPF